MARARVLIGEDEDDIRLLLRVLIDRAGYEAIEARNGREVLRQLHAHRPDLVILDVRMPEMDGWETLARIRDMSDVPVLMLTAATEELDKVRGLRAGADDYVGKPFGNQELLARVEALLRRSPGRAAVSDAYVDDKLTVDFEQRRVTTGVGELALTPLEFRLLAALVNHPNQVLSHEQLIGQVWGDHDVGRGRLKLYVGYLRRKLAQAPDPPSIESVRGFGYRYRVTDTAR
jgi:DNA-binding response OmpR family regulator